jgi:hypothetical protein
VNGLRSKLKDNDFVTFVCDYDILCFSETWLGPGSDPQIDGYNCVHVPGRKVNTRGRYCGGVSVYYKTVFRNRYVY